MSTPEQPPPPQPAPAQPQVPGTPGMAVAGFVVGLIGLLTSWIFVLGLVISIVGIVLSVVGRRQAADRGAPSGLATAGLVCAIIGAVIAVIITVLVGIFLDEADESLDDITFTTTTANFVVGLRMLRGRVIPPRRSHD